MGSSWHVDETYTKVKGVGKYLYRAIDKEGKTIDFLLNAKREQAVAIRFFENAIQDNGIPKKVSMDKSSANKSAIDKIIEGKNISVIVRQLKYLNNIVEQDQRAIKRITKRMPGFTSFQAAKNVLVGITNPSRVNVKIKLSINLVFEC